MRGLPRDISARAFTYDVGTAKVRLLHDALVTPERNVGVRLVFFSGASVSVMLVQ
jgi:hypothetical protein